MSHLQAVVTALLVLAVPFGTSACAAVADEAPPIFDKRPYDVAQRAARDSNKWFLVKATAVWCGPCKRMDKTTWRDEKVVEWLRNHAVTLAFDVDDEQTRARELRVEAMPTMIAFKDGQEFDRIVGYKDPEAFLGWLEGLARGEKSVDAVRKRAEGDESGKVAVSARLDLARSLAHSGEYDQAADEYVWLWQHMLEHEPAYYGVRLSYVAGEMEQLASKADGAKQRFQALRGETAKDLEKEPVALQSVVDWVTLNQIVGERQATLEWYDRVQGQDRWQASIQRVAADLKALLLAEKRWADLGRLSADPFGELEKQQQLIALAARGFDDEGERRMLEEMGRERLRATAGQLYAGLLAAEREADAGALAAKARELDGSPAMLSALLSTALEADQARREQLDWLDAAGDEAALNDLRARIETALGKS